MVNLVRPATGASATGARTPTRGRSAYAVTVLARSLQEPHAAVLDLVNRAHNFHAAFGAARLPLGRLENLAQCPADVAFDGSIQSDLERNLRIEIRRCGQQRVHQNLNPRTLAGVPVLGFEGRLDRSTALVAEDHQERCLQVRSRILQTPRDLR